MKRPFNAFIAVFALLALSMLGAAPSLADSFPQRSIRMVVAFPPGGGTDIVARIFADHLSRIWGQPVVVENKAGAGGVIGTEYVARADPDGYTILMGTMGNLSVNQHLYPMTIDPVRDLAPVAQAVAVHFVCVVNPAFPPRTIKELIALAKERPGQVNYSSSGTGGAPHLAGALFNEMAGVEMVHVPYKGSGPSFTGLLGDQVALTFDSLVQSLPYIKSGKLIPLAVLGTKRSPLLPEVPTMAEAGLPGYDVTNWYGVVAPAGTPLERIAKLNAGFRQVQSDPEVREKLDQMGADVTPTTPEEFGALIKNESSKWAEIVERAGIKPN